MRLHVDVCFDSIGNNERPHHTLFGECLVIFSHHTDTNDISLVKIPNMFEMEKTTTTCACMRKNTTIIDYPQTNEERMAPLLVKFEHTKKYTPLIAQFARKLSDDSIRSRVLGKRGGGIALDCFGAS